MDRRSYQWNCFCTITVNSLPVVTASSIPTSGAICIGSNATLNGGGATSYTWTGGVTNGTAFAPTTTTTYTVTGTDANGCVNTATKTITVNSLPIVTASSIPTSGQVCIGSNATLNGGGATSYTWTGGVTNGTAFVPTTTTTYTVTGTDAITVNSLPVVTASSIPTSGAICIGSNATLNGGGATSYTWTGGVTNGTAFAPTTTTTYTVTGTDANGCVNTATKTITVNSLPTITASSIPTSGAICIGSNATLNGAGATSYTWTGGVTNGTAFAPTTTTTYTVTGTDANGCVNTATKTVIVNALPTITVTNPIAVCSPNTIDLTASAVTTGSTASLVYGYFTNAAATTVLGSASAVATSGTYYIKGTDGNSCSSISPVVATINPLPTVTLVATKSKICLGESLTLTGAGATSYSWTGGVTNGTAFAPTTTTTYTLTGTDINGCVNIASVTIPVNPLPTITQITSSANKLMVGSDLILNNSASNGLPPYSYIWNNSDPSVAGVNGFLNPTLTGLKVGFVDLKYYVIDGNGCKSLTSNVFNVEIIPALMKFEIPNAFIPTDMYMDNKFLKAAYNSSVKRVNYFRVFNRMGKLVYEIQNADPSAIKWDGTYNNVMQEPDGYMWIAEITGLGEVTFERKSGQFLLIK
ncbi:MAG: gliding motility-associated C-terminal domain-containing protein [Bacteroidetes bacterium]|nr:gliding motility-associated C-terminal domain-containing protein [Bacteroidota bacterium]